VCVCLCAYTHAHTHTLQLPAQIEKTWNNISVFSSVKNNSLCQQQVPCINHFKPFTPNSRRWYTKCTYTSACAHPVERVFTSMYASVKNINHSVQTCICTGAHNTGLVHATPTTNIDIHTRLHTDADSAAKYLQSKPKHIWENPVLPTVRWQTTSFSWTMMTFWLNQTSNTEHAGFNTPDSRTAFALHLRLIFCTSSFHTKKLKIHASPWLSSSYCVL